MGGKNPESTYLPFFPLVEQIFLVLFLDIHPQDALNSFLWDYFFDVK